MTVGPSALAERVAGLTREEAIEAALALADEIAGPEAGQVPEAALTFTQEVEAAPYAYLPEIDQLARALLIAAGSHEEWHAQVDEVLEGVGQKAFVFGGTEIVALATLGVIALGFLLSKGKASEWHREEEENGKKVTEHETIYVMGAMGPKLAEALAKMISGFQRP